MSKVTDLIARNREVVTILECGHQFSHIPFDVQYQGVTADEYVAKPENREYYIGHRQRCENEH